MVEKEEYVQMRVCPPFLFLLLIVRVLCSPLPARELHHYVFFNMDRDLLRDPAFLRVRAFEGAQVKYTWKQLESEKDRYDFSIIREDREFLSSRGKRLFIQLQDVTFDPSRNCVPRYLLEEKEYHGGVALQCDDRGAPEGQVARRWDPAVRERFHKLLAALGKEFDGTIEGINLPETAVGIGTGGQGFPSGFTCETYRDGIVATVKALKKSFPRSVALLYANFMPGEWLPDCDHSYLRGVFRCARETGVGVGGPDLLPWKQGQMNNGYSFIKDIKGAVPVGIAVQEGNYDHVSPKTHKRVTIKELIDFAANYLGADYIFWCTEEPHYTKELIPFMNAHPFTEHQ
jgi:hypothetical protein